MRKLLSRRTIAVVVVGAAAVAVMGVAGAAAMSSAVSSIYYGKADCGATANTSFDTIGSVKMMRSPGTLSFTVKLRNAIPDNDYDIQLWKVSTRTGGDSTCTFFESFGFLTTDDNGNATESYSLKINAADKGIKHWFVDPFDTSVCQVAPVRSNCPGAPTQSGKPPIYFGDNDTVTLTP